MHGSMFIVVLGLQVAWAQFDPHFMPNRSVIVQLLEWKFEDIGRECVDFLGPRGFGAVLVSPVSENVKQADDGPFWERYQPISYKIISRSGNRDEFLSMTQTCNTVGVRIYVAVEFNHMGTKVPDHEQRERGHEVGIGGSTANSVTGDYPAVPFRSEHFHRRCSVNDYTDAYQVRTCRWHDNPDIDHSQEYTRNKIVEFLNELVILGAAGFQVDLADLIWPYHIHMIMSRVIDLNTEFGFPDGARPFVVQAVYDFLTRSISKTEYMPYGAIFEALYAVKIASIFYGREPFSTLENWGPAVDGFMPSNVVVFVQTHFTQRDLGFQNFTYIRPDDVKTYTMGVAFMLAHPYGIKQLFSSYTYEHFSQGPPVDQDYVVVSPVFNDDGQCIENTGVSRTQWVCEHRWNGIANMVDFCNYVAGEDIKHFQILASNQVAFCRGDKGFMVLNNDAEMDLLANVYACVEAGDYCDVISGALKNNKCTGDRITVSEERTASVFLAADGEFGALAIYGASRLIY